jgi:hypothetical protein
MAAALALAGLKALGLDRDHRPTTVAPGPFSAGDAPMGIWA